MDIYDTETLEKKITYNPKGSDVSSLYQDNGYLFSNIQPIEVGVIGDSVDIEMRVYEGAQATINKNLKRLINFNLAKSEPYRSIFLTKEGKKLAQISKEKHEIVL